MPWPPVTIIAPLDSPRPVQKPRGASRVPTRWEHGNSERHLAGDHYTEVVQWTEGVLVVLLVGSPGWIDARLFDPVAGVFSMPLFSDSFLAAKTTPDLTVACACSS